MNWKRVIELKELFDSLVDRDEIDKSEYEYIALALFTLIGDPPTQQMPMIIPASQIPDWMRRVPKETKEILPEGTQTTIVTSNLEQFLIGVTRTNKLTDAQRFQLNNFVVVLMENSDEEFASINELYDTNGIFKEFANEKIKAMASHGAPNGKIINALMNYGSSQGWFAYQKNHNNQIDEMRRTVKPKDIPSRYSDIDNLGYSPDAK